MNILNKWQQFLGQNKKFKLFLKKILFNILFIISTLFILYIIKNNTLNFLHLILEYFNLNDIPLNY